MREPQGVTEAIEAHVDRCGLSTIVEVLAIVCEEKADHIRSNWQDGTRSADVSAAPWSRTAKELDKLAARVKLRGL